MLAVLVVGSMVVEGANPFAKLKSANKLIYIGVNALIIGAVLYFGLSLIPQIKPGQNKTGQIIFLIVIIIFAIMFAAYMQKTIGNKFIWSSDAFKSGKDYLFKQDYTNKEGAKVYGILHPAHIWKFIGFALIITWLFITFLKVGQGNQVIDIILAIILSAYAVHQGISLNSVVRLGQLVALFIFTVQFSKTFNFGNKKFNWVFSAVIAIILVWVISYIVFGTGWLLISDASKSDGKQMDIIPGIGPQTTSNTQPAGPSDLGFWIVTILTLLALLTPILIGYIRRNP